jgi:hypothetical protein
MAVRILLLLVLAAAAALTGCAGISTTPYNAAESCVAIGGTYTADGQCLAGNM